MTSLDLVIFSGTNLKVLGAVHVNVYGHNLTHILCSFNSSRFSVFVMLVAAVVLFIFHWFLNC